MPTENLIALIFVAILAIVINFAFVAMEQENKNRVPTPVSHLSAIMLLAESGNWSVSILRRSGYNDAACRVPGSRYAALELAVSKLRQARIDTVEVVCNTPNKLEVRAFYDSTGSRRTGKYVGGFIIVPDAG